MSRRIIAIGIVSMFIIVGSAHVLQAKTYADEKDRVIATIDGFMRNSYFYKESIVGELSWIGRDGFKLLIYPHNEDFHFELYRKASRSYSDSRFWSGFQVFKDDIKYNAIGAFSFLPSSGQIQHAKPIPKYPNVEYFSGGIQSKLGFYQIVGQIHWEIK